MRERESVVISIQNCMKGDARTMTTIEIADKLWNEGYYGIDDMYMMMPHIV